MNTRCTCPTCQHRTDKLRAQIIRHNGLPIIDVRVTTERHLHEAIEHIQSLLCIAQTDAEYAALNLKLDQLTNKLASLQKPNVEATNHQTQ